MLLHSVRRTVPNSHALSNSRITLAALLSLCLAITACETGGKRYTLRGQVLKTNVSSNEITVKHEEIPGFMPAMTMAYKVKDPRVVPELKAGDKIVADLVSVNQANDYWLEGIRITEEDPHQVTPAVAHSVFLSAGEHVPDLSLTNQDGRSFALNDLRGQAVLMTFIYTRCPMPNFCPRLSSEFAKIHEDLAKTPGDYQKTHLVTISFDPKYDTPAVLRKYGLAYLDNDPSGFSHWTFASTAPADLRELARAFGLEYFEEDDQITHTMDIVLINPDGTVAKYWAYHGTASELEDALRQAAHSASASAPTASEKRYPLDGEVVSIDTKAAELTVRHKDIPGYMTAMTMAYKVNESHAINGVAVGDHIHANLVVSKDGTYLENIAVTKQGEMKASR